MEWWQARRISKSLLVYRSSISYPLSIEPVILNLPYFYLNKPDTAACTPVFNMEVLSSRFWMSFICCLLSVLSIMAVNTIIQYMPLIFLMQAEKSQGDVSFFVRAESSRSTLSSRPRIRPIPICVTRLSRISSPLQHSMTIKRAQKY